MEPTTPTPPQPTPTPNPLPEQPTMTEPAPTAGTMPTPPPAVPVPDNGKALAIVGLIMAFVGLQLIGLILSIVAKRKAAKPSSTHTIALVGIILNAALMVVTVLVISMITIVAYNGISTKANTNLALAAEQSLTKSINTYIATNNKLPTTASQLTLPSDVHLGTVTTKPTSPDYVEYAYCAGGSIARLGYWDYTKNEPVYTYFDSTGGSTTSTDCTVVQ